MKNNIIKKIIVLNVFILIILFSKNVVYGKSYTARSTAKIEKEIKDDLGITIDIDKDAEEGSFPGKKDKYGEIWDIKVKKSVIEEKKFDASKGEDKIIKVSKWDATATVRDYDTKSYSELTTALLEKKIKDDLGIEIKIDSQAQSGSFAGHKDNYGYEWNIEVVNKERYGWQATATRVSGDTENPVKTNNSNNSGGSNGSSSGSGGSSSGTSSGSNNGAYTGPSSSYNGNPSSKGTVSTNDWYTNFANAIRQIGTVFGGGVVDFSETTVGKTIINFVNAVTSIITFIAAGLAMIHITWLGFRFVLHADRPEARKELTGQLHDLLIRVMLLAGFWVIVKLLISVAKVIYTVIVSI